MARCFHRIFDGRENSFFVHDFLTCPSNDDAAFRVIRLVNGDESKKSKLLADKLNFLS